MERLAEQLNSEVSLLNLDMPANYDWKVVSLVQKVNKRLIEDLDRLMTERCPQWYVYNFGESYRSLDTKVHMATKVISDMLQMLAMKAMQ